MKKQTLLIFFLVLGSVLATAQVRLAIKPIDFQGKTLLYPVLEKVVSMLYFKTNYLIKKFDML